MQQRITDRSGMTVGIINDRGADVVAYDNSMRMIGRFDKSANVTYDHNNYKIGNGDQLMRLF